MGKSKSLQSAACQRGNAGKIPDVNLQAKVISDDELQPVFSFKCACTNRFKLSEWSKKELESLIASFKKMEARIWRDVKTTKGLNYKPVDNIPYKLPSSVPPDATIHEFKVDDGKRVMGYRAQQVFHVVWFDREHKVFEEGKVRRQ